MKINENLLKSTEIDNFNKKSIKNIEKEFITFNEIEEVLSKSMTHQ